MLEVTMGGSPRRVQDGFSEVERWQRAAVGRELQDAEAVETQLAEIEAQFAELQARKAALETALAEAHLRAEAVADASNQRTHEALFDILLEQSRAVEVRAVAVKEAEDGSDSRWLRVLAEGPLAAKLTEYTEYRRKVEPGLAAFPETYREVVRTHHEGVKAVLTNWFEEQDLEPAEVSRAELPIDLLIAVDVPEDDVAVLMAVLPVSAAVQSRWAERHDGLGMCIAARAVEGLYRAAHHLGHRSSQVLFGGHRGLMAVELEVPGDPAALGPAFCGAVQAALDRSPELVAAKVRAQVRVVDIHHMLPAEAFEEDSDAG